MSVFLDDLQREVGTWAEATFPQSTIESASTHLAREVEGFRRSGAVPPHGWDAEELADCALIILHLAHKMGVSLENECVKKHDKNRRRRWGKPDADGVVEHIREEATP